MNHDLGTLHGDVDVGIGLDAEEFSVAFEEYLSQKIENGHITARGVVTQGGTRFAKLLGI